MSLTLTFIIDFLWHYTLPSLALFIINMARWMSSMRIIISAELGSDYIHYSESLGTKDRIVYGYAFRNSLLLQVTGLALSIGGAIAGQALVEAVFSYPGMGYYLQQAIGQIDYPLIQGIFVITIAVTHI
uniref:ABC transporter permease n=1 Tax=Ignisphaera aggregans TaxID=334771 RepID=A0A7C4CZV5_9CREN